MRTLSKSMAAVVTAAMTGGILLGASGIANAAYNPSAPPYPADSNNQASLTIFNATTGAVVTGGSNATSLDNYFFVSSSSTYSPNHTKATLAGYLAEAGKVPGAFSGEGLAPATTYPVTTAPAPVNGVTTPTARGANTSSFGVLATDYPNLAPSTSDFYQLYQLRVTTTFPTPQSLSYAYADIAIDTTTNTWRQLAPTSSTAPLPPATPGKPTATAGNTTAAVTVPATSGATSFTVTASPGGASQTGAGPTFNFTSLTNGTAYTFTATATNANGTTAASPASDPVTPSAPVPTSNTALAVTSPSSGYNDTPYTLTATVSSTGAPAEVNSGSVSFFDNGSTTALGSVPGTAGGQYVLPQILAAGSHSIVAKFTPTNAANIGASQSAAQAFVSADPPTGACAVAGSVCTDTQNIQTVVPVGTLVINTPYTSTNPLKLPTMGLNAAGTQFGTSATFSPIIVTDTRAGDLPWTAKALSSDLVLAGPASPNGRINSQNVGLTGVNKISNSTNYTGTTTFFENPAADPAQAPAATGSLGLGGTTAHTFAASTNGRGTVTMAGLLSVTAPTSTVAGTYNGTIVFTVG